MKNSIIFIFLLLFPLIGRAQSACRSVLLKYGWDNKLMLVFAPSIHDPDYQNQLKRVKHHADDLRLREVKVIWLLNSGPAKVGANLLSKAEVKQMQKAYHVRTDVFTVILVDQKGRLRLRETKPIVIKDVFKNQDHRTSIVE